VSSSLLLSDALLPDVDASRSAGGADTLLLLLLLGMFAAALHCMPYRDSWCLCLLCNVPWWHVLATCLCKEALDAITARGL
jgi:hypothetical protein